MPFFLKAWCTFCRDWAPRKKVFRIGAQFVSDWKEFACDRQPTWLCLKGRTDRPLIDIDEDTFSSHLGSLAFSDFLTMGNDQWSSTGKIERAEEIKSGQRYFFNNYGYVRLTVPIDWSAGQPGKNNLSWQLHSLNFLADLVAGYIYTKDDWYLQHAGHILADWAEHNIGKDIPSKFSWNDHATAIRLKNIGQFFLYLWRIAYHDKSILKSCVILAGQHQAVLACENFHIKGTNHGLDQAFSLYQSSLFFSFLSKSEEIKNIAMRRLSYEMKCAFTQEGVHIENSPQYHEVILNSVLWINSYISRVEGTESIDGMDDLVENALTFLSYMLRPDGKFPPIGDSLMSPPRSGFEALSKYPAFKNYLYARSMGKSGSEAVPASKIYPDSGYAIFRSRTFSEPLMRLHIVFKCGFKSVYHRHDDDNSFLLFAFGEEWLTDGGLYVYDAENPQREHFRSCHSHNVLAPVDAVTDRTKCPSPEPRICGFALEDEVSWVQARTAMYKGFSYSRKLAYDGACHIRVDDQIERHDGKAQEYVQYWNIPADKEIQIRDGVISIASRAQDIKLKISHSSDVQFTIAHIMPGMIPHFAYRSVEYGLLEPIQVIRISYSAVAILDTIAEFDFETDN